MKPASSIFSRLEENGEPPRQSFQVLSNPSGYTTRNPCLSASSSNSKLEYWRMPAPSPPEGCSTNNNGAPGFKVFGTYSMKVRSRPPTVVTWRVASPIGSAATAVATSANAAPIVQCGSVVSAMISPYHPPNLPRQRGRAHQKLVDRVRGLASFADRPDHQRLPAPHVAAGEHFRVRAAVGNRVGLDVAAWVELELECGDHALVHRMHEAHRQQHEIGLHVELGPGNRLELVVDMRAVQRLDASILAREAHR